MSVLKIGLVFSKSAQKVIRMTRVLLRGQVEQVDRLGFDFSVLAEVLENNAWWVESE